MSNRYPLFKAWPLLIAVIIATVLNFDYFLAPILRRGLGLSCWSLLIVGMCLSVSEALYEYWFFGWLVNFIKEYGKIKETIRFGKKISRELERDGYIDRIVNYFKYNFDKAIDPDNKVVKAIKAGGWLTLFVAGLEPFPTGRTIGIILSRIAGSRKALYTVMIGNLIHVAIVVGVWELLFRIF